MGISKKVIFSIIISISLCVIYSHSSYAGTDPITKTSDVTATIPTYTIDDLYLINPTNESAVSTSAPVLSWHRPDSLPGIDHSELYIDDQIFADDIDNDLTPQSMYFYTINLVGDVFFLTPQNTTLSEGWHTWYVKTYGVQPDTSDTTSTWRFYVDTTAPYIILDTIDSDIYNWQSNNPVTIPPEDQRYLEVSSKTPTMAGLVETSANISISVICPTTSSSCTNKTYTYNASTGVWSQKTATLLADEYYTIQISATDASGNSTTFPVFYIRYSTPATVTPTTTTTPTATITPTVTTKPTSTPTIITTTPTPTLIPGLIPLLTEPAFTTLPPPRPTPPPKVPPTLKKVQEAASHVFVYEYSTGAVITLVFGLILHFLMGSYGKRVPLAVLIHFISITIFPFLAKKKYQTLPFCIIEVFRTNNLSKPLYSTISDPEGYFDIDSKITGKIFVIIKSVMHERSVQILDTRQLDTLCIYPIQEKISQPYKRFRNSIYNLRIIPLILAIITSILFLAFISHPIIYAYLYIALQALYSQYLHPYIKKQLRTL